MLWPEGLFVNGGSAFVVGFRLVGPFLMAEYEPESGQRAC
jgi:hypothetical protein